MKEKMRCPWGGANDLYIPYHDKEWGAPCHDDMRHFEFLVLEAAQAGLSWLTVLKKREAYRKAYRGFDPVRVARFSARDVERLLGDPGIVRNRLKISSSINNASRFLDVQKEFGSFDAYLWHWTGGRPVVNRWTEQSQVPPRTELSDAISKDLKARGLFLCRLDHHLLAPSGGGRGERSPGDLLPMERGSAPCRGRCPRPRTPELTHS